MHTDGYAVVVRGSNPKHVLHLILSLVTCLFWTPVWAIVQKRAARGALHRTEGRLVRQQQF